ncbi:hypothetical protein CVT25_006166 [Psilocybe cyanescens]|uniref:Uncharacterized protein n=1 Tax=Psilocybe cyanescens TaxID=93625 RepID=A0A409XIK0_PSICY|nr:hypothetical protein CVT25_006166 [Psilocybe cyanescens]
MPYAPNANARNASDSLDMFWDVRESDATDSSLSCKNFVLRYLIFLLPFFAHTIIRTFQLKNSSLGRPAADQRMYILSTYRDPLLNDRSDMILRRDTAYSANNTSLTKKFPALRWHLSGGPVIISPVILISGRAAETLDLDIGVVVSVTHPTHVAIRAVRKPSDAFNIDDAHTSHVSFKLVAIVFNAFTTYSSLINPFLI